MNPFKVAAVVALLAAVVCVLFMFSLRQPEIAHGSVVTGSEYGYATTTAAGNTNVRSNLISPGCTLGSVVIASSSATAFTIWNAASTTDAASTTIATFEANAAEGTYTFDVACPRGISIIAPTGFNGFVITTHR